MNKLNPLHIGALLIVLLIFSFFKLDEAKKQLHDAQTAYKESEHLALELSALKDTYGDKKRIQNGIKKILRLRSLQAANVEATWKKKSVIITAKSLDLKALNTLMGKFLNGNFNIVKLKIKKIDDLKAGVEMEIQW